jgi:uncharacterized protein YdhG (YjbR/CyaY superfamily)
MGIKYKSVKAYFLNQLPETQVTLNALKTIIKETVPHCEETLNYGIPAYTLVKGGKRDKQIMIAGYGKFASLYVGNYILNHFRNELKGYTVGRASVQFPNGKSLPVELIIRIIKHKMSTMK